MRRGTASPISAGSGTTFSPAALVRAGHSATPAATTSRSCAGSRSLITRVATSRSGRIVSGSFKNLSGESPRAWASWRSTRSKRRSSALARRLADETAQFRDGLDELKAAVGLPQGALVIPDPGGIAAFREVFEKVHNWHRDPTRTFKGLPELIARLPALGEVVVEGRPILGTIEANPDRLEDELAAMMRSAVKNRNSLEKGEAPARHRDPRAA